MKKTKATMWLMAGILALILLMLFTPMAYWQADGRIALETFVSFIVGIMVILLWEVIREAYRAI